MDNLIGKWATYYGDRVKVLEDDGPEADEVKVAVWSTGEHEWLLREDLTDISEKR
jgi:hypothetical protein